MGKNKCIIGCLGVYKGTFRPQLMIKSLDIFSLTRVKLRYILLQHHNCLLCCFTQKCCFWINPSTFPISGGEIECSRFDYLS